MPYLAFNLNNGNEFVFDLVEERLSLGRSSRNDIVIQNTFISNLHAELLRQADGNYEVVDLNSTGGTFLNGGRIDRSVLKPGDKLRFGPLDARYDLAESTVPGKGEEDAAVPGEETTRHAGESEDRGTEAWTPQVQDSPPDTAPSAASVVVKPRLREPETLVGKVLGLTGSVEAAVAGESERAEESGRKAAEREPAGTASDELRIRLIPSEIAQRQRAKAELAELMAELEHSKREVEFMRQNLADLRSAEQHARERLPKQPGVSKEYLADLRKDRGQENVRRSAPFGSFVMLTLLVNLAALVAAAYWAHNNLPAEIKTQLADYLYTRLADSPRPTPPPPARNATPIPLADVPEQAAPVSAPPPAPAPSPAPAAPPAATPPAPATKVALLGEDLPPSQRELVLLKERNRLTAYADEAIATGVRASYDRLWEAFHDPQLANLVHAARSEILRVHNAYLSGSRIDHFNIPVGDYFPEDSALLEDQLSDAKLIKLLGNPANPWEVRMKAANLLGTRNSIEVGDALVKAVRSDPNLDVVKEATFSFDQLTGFHCQIFDAASLAKWWNQHRANPLLPGPQPESTAANAPAPTVGSATGAVTTK